MATFVILLHETFYFDVSRVYNRKKFLGMLINVQTGSRKINRK